MRRKPTPKSTRPNYMHKQIFCLLYMPSTVQCLSTGQHCKQHCCNTHPPRGSSQLIGTVNPRNKPFEPRFQVYASKPCAATQPKVCSNSDASTQPQFSQCCKEVLGLVAGLALGKTEPPSRSSWLCYLPETTVGISFAFYLEI